MGSSSSKTKKENEKKEDNEIKIFKTEEQNNLNTNNILTELDKDLNKIGNKEENTGKLKLPPLNSPRKTLKKNATNLGSGEFDQNELEIENKKEENENIDKEEGEINNHIKNGEIIINKININKEKKNNAKKDGKEKENKEGKDNVKKDGKDNTNKEGENNANKEGKEDIKEEGKEDLLKEEKEDLKEEGKESEIDNNVDAELFKPIATLNLNRKSVMKKSKYRGITFVQNLKEFFPEDISKEEIRTMVINALSEYIVQNPKDYVKGKNLTREQSEALADIVYNKVKNNEDDVEENENNDLNKTEKYKILDEVKVKIGMSDLNKDIAKKLFFKNRDDVSEEELKRTINNLSQGNENVKVLIIELL